MPAVVNRTNSVEVVPSYRLNIKLSPAVEYKSHDGAPADGDDAFPSRRSRVSSMSAPCNRESNPLITNAADAGNVPAPTLAAVSPVIVAPVTVSVWPLATVSPKLAVTSPPNVAAPTQSNNPAAVIVPRSVNVVELTGTV